MTKIIWVTEGLMANTKLAEALKELPNKECVLVKVGTVQEAICRLFEDEQPASLIICDHELHKSIPKRELREAAEMKDVTYLVAKVGEDKKEEQLLVAERHELPKKGPIGILMENLRVTSAPSYIIDDQTLFA
jgi:hypothetical protein